METILALALKNWKYILVGLIVAAVVGGGVWKFQQMRIDSAKIKLQVAIEANAENIKTIEALKAEIRKSTDTCTARLAQKDATIKKLKDIDNLGGKDETTGDNPLRDALNRMWLYN